ncbi:unnamed protein product [Mytilus edulis]|uniref:Uncharacterized protein n=1 Tax=Mytilus edulis TaxID=6550 RepID=A0A8S3VQV0_MYTED|nr:unnamed protein product [Mytilus edulis]
MTLHTISYVPKQNYSSHVVNSLIAHSKKTTWLKSFESCKDGFGGSAFFKYCQPSTCNASNAIGKIANRSSNKIEKYWINGFVQRSPIVVYEGCYYKYNKLIAEDKLFKLSDNSVFSCSYTCQVQKGDYIFLNNETCLCVPKEKYRNLTMSETRTTPSKFGYVIQSVEKTTNPFIGTTCGRTGKPNYDYCHKRDWRCVQTQMEQTFRILQSSIPDTKLNVETLDYCLRLEVWQNIAKLKVGDCNENLQPLCVLKDAANDHDSKYDILFGSVGAILGVLLIVAIVILLIQRHKKILLKTPKKAHEYYSEPNLLPTSEERHPLEYVTEDGVYNHLGDTEENFDSKPSSSVYDVFGHTDVEYDISMSSHKRIENIGDMYDSSRGVAVYDTTHDQNINNRPESQIYNIISTR